MRRSRKILCRLIALRRLEVVLLIIVVLVGVLEITMLKVIGRTATSCLEQSQR